jgi:hypothetical protein
MRRALVSWSSRPGSVGGNARVHTGERYWKKRVNNLTPLPLGRSRGRTERYDAHRS